MSCISSNFSSFFLNSLNDPSEFSKYLSNGELRFSSTFEDFQVYSNSNATPQQQQQYQQQQQLLANHPHAHLNGHAGGDAMNNGDESNSNLENTQPSATVQQQQQQYGNYHHQQQQQQQQQQQHTHPLMHLQQHQQRWTAANSAPQGHGTPQAAAAAAATNTAANASAAGGPQSQSQQHFDGSFEFMKYLRHSNDYTENSHDPRHPHHPGGAPAINASNGPTAIGTKLDTSLNANNNSLIDLDTPHKQSSRSSRKTPAAMSSSSAHHHHNGNSSNSNSNHPTPMSVDMYDHDSKHTIFDLHHMNSAHSSNSNESSMELSSLTYPNSHLNASNSNTSSEEGNGTHGRSDFSMLGVTSSAGGATSSATSNAVAKSDDAAASPAPPKCLATFAIVENFEPHPSHKVEEGIFQHMNKLPTKKKETLKELGVRFTGQMTLNDKSIIVDNFIKFCHEYDIQDHRPFLSLNQSGLNKADQIKFARYLGQGLPTFTLFCIYSNFKNLFCTKRTEIYMKDGYNLPNILDKTKVFLAKTAADLKNIISQQSNDEMDFLTAATATAIPSSAATVAPSMANNCNAMNNNLNPMNTPLPPPLMSAQQQQQQSQQQHYLQPQSTTTPLMNSSIMTSMMPPGAAAAASVAVSSHPNASSLPPPLPPSTTSHRPLENLMIYENYEVHESHRVEDGFCTQLSRLPPKKQELLKQFGIQTNQTVTYYEKYILIENFNRFCNEYKMADHRPFLDLSESGLPKSEQLKFLRYLGQGLPNLTLNKIYLVFKDLLGLSRIEKMSLDGYNLDVILKKKKRNLYNRMTAAAVHKECNPDVPTPAIPPALTHPPKPAPKQHIINNVVTKVTPTTITGTINSAASVPPSTPTSSVLMPLYSQQQDSYKT